MSDHYQGSSHMWQVYNQSYLLERSYLLLQTDSVNPRTRFPTQRIVSQDSATQHHLWERQQEEEEGKEAGEGTKKKAAASERFTSYFGVLCEQGIIRR